MRRTCRPGCTGAAPGVAPRAALLTLAGACLAGVIPTHATEPAPVPPRRGADVGAALPSHLDLESLRAAGPAVMPVLADLYTRSGPQARQRLAYFFHALGWESPEAVQALLSDARSADRELRVRVQYALLAVSRDPVFVDMLLDAMVSDPDSYVREKSACAVAGARLRLSEEQTVWLYARLIRMLSHPEKRTRTLAIRVLIERTGQSKQFFPGDPPEERERSVREWEAWLKEYMSHH